ncbi:EamA family transporter [Pseudobacter ginsenosidimutans]|uniref:Drug/metabolite transporter (DMT)-like permease n=1 Tax=Pseudobacter ginsenosidimutans TaxID=661488 RepID=A0A4Q7MUT6_9BACT|nr:EamA family transporter [Pseudobacter ginsenosidimutans]QEC41473.1 EamA family transporter [Pseudobacter ginsenosidimutans]RZS71744.1 drug/metabolite transporter (DMT)-like permease [Pseudobacter ginsenosidimutans]
MSTVAKKPASTIMVILAFATVYLVWGSTYFFIQKAVHDFPPLIMGAFRFLVAGGIMLAWCLIRGEKLWNPQQFKAAIITGALLLFIGNGCVIWAEKTLPSSLVAVWISSAPIWFLLLDKSKWKENFRSTSTIVGLIIGFIGVVLLLSDQLDAIMNTPGGGETLVGLLIVLAGCISWAGGSIYSKYNSTGSALVNTTIQMLTAGFIFLPGSFIAGEWKDFSFAAVSNSAWLSLAYLIVFGSILAFSAYVWLLQVRSPTQVSTYAYVNPVVAVLLGVFFANEVMSFWQLLGLGVILGSVLLINLAKYRNSDKGNSGKGSTPVLNKRLIVSNAQEKMA